MSNRNFNFSSAEGGAENSMGSNSGNEYIPKHSSIVSHIMYMKTFPKAVKDSYENLHVSAMYFHIPAEHLAEFFYTVITQKVEKRELFGLKENVPMSDFKSPYRNAEKMTRLLYSVSVKNFDGVKMCITVLQPSNPHHTVIVYGIADIIKTIRFKEDIINMVEMCFDSFVNGSDLFE